MLNKTLHLARARPVWYRPGGIFRHPSHLPLMLAPSSDPTSSLVSALRDAAGRRAPSPFLLSHRRADGRAPVVQGPLLPGDRGGHRRRYLPEGPPRRPASRSRMAVGGDGRRSARLDRSLVWIVDPIDGTRAFSTGHPDWSVSIALVRDGRPVLGVIYAPIHDHLYEAKLGGGAWRNARGCKCPGLTGTRPASPVPSRRGPDCPQGGTDRAPAESALPGAPPRPGRRRLHRCGLGLVQRP